MNINITAATLIIILLLFSYIILIVILLEIYYFEKTLVELTGLINHLLLKG